MSIFVPNPSGDVRIGRWCWTTVLVACLCVSGCASVDLRGEGFREDEMSAWIGQFRPCENPGHPYAFTNKGRQIERSLGGS